MEKLTISGLSKSDLKRLIEIEEQGIGNYEWLTVDEITLTADEQQQLQNIKSRLLNYDTHLMNEATIWARGIYPLLVLAEKSDIQAWAGVSLQAKYAKFEIEGIADGVLGRCASGFIEAPYLILVEAKRGLEAQNPLYQLYGQMITAAHLNWENNNNSPQEVFGCYTIADVWKFIRAEISDIDSDLPKMRLEYSREYVEKLEAETILRIIKGIVGLYLNQ